MKPPSLTIGVEEEYQIIDPETRELQSYITQMLEYDHRFLGQVKPSFTSPSSKSARPCAGRRRKCGKSSCGCGAA